MIEKEFEQQATSVLRKYIGDPNSPQTREKIVNELMDFLGDFEVKVNLEPQTPETTGLGQVHLVLFDPKSRKSYQVLFCSKWIGF